MVHPGVATVEGRVFGDEEWEVKVAIDVKDGELIVSDKRSCERERKTERRRWRSEGFYSLPGWTLCVSTPPWLSRSLLQLNTLSIRSGTCVLMGNCGGIRSS